MGARVCSVGGSWSVVGAEGRGGGGDAKGTLRVCGCSGSVDGRSWNLCWSTVVERGLAGFLDFRSGFSCAPSA